MPIKEQIRLLSVVHFVYAALTALAVTPVMWEYKDGLRRIGHAPIQTFHLGEGLQQMNLMLREHIGWGILIMVAMAFLNLAAGFHLRNLRHRHFCLLVAFLNCFFQDYGILICIGSFFILTGTEAKALFPQPATPAA